MEISRHDGGDVDLAPHPLFAKLAQSLLREPESKRAIVKVVKESPELEDEFKGKSDEEKTAQIEECICECLRAGPWPFGLEPDDVAGVMWVTETDLTDKPVLKCLLEEAANALTRPNAPLDFVTLRGYLAPGDIEDRKRLYADPDLENFISLRKDDILLRHRFHTEHAPYDLVDVVWIRRTVAVGRARRQVRRDHVAEFLEGELMEAAEVASDLPTRIAGSTSDEPFCVSYTCCKRTSRCAPGGRG